MSVSAVYEAAENGAEKMRIGSGFCLLIGGAVGVVAVVIFALLILSQRGNRAVAPREKDVLKLSVSRPALSDSPSLCLMLSASGILNILVEDVYAATSNLSESNIIGEGTAGIRPLCVLVFTFIKIDSYFLTHFCWY